jgi:hypothetical protein
VREARHVITVDTEFIGPAMRERSDHAGEVFDGDWWQALSQ